MTNLNINKEKIEGKIEVSKMPPIILCSMTINKRPVNNFHTSNELNLLTLQDIKSNLIWIEKMILWLAWISWKQTFSFPAPIQYHPISSKNKLLGKNSSVMITSNFRNCSSTFLSLQYVLWIVTESSSWLRW